MVTRLLIGVAASAVIAATSSLTSAARVAPLAPQREASAPEARVLEFCRLNADGGHLTEEGWRQIASFFITPGIRGDFTSPSSSTVAVTAGCVIEYAKVAADGQTATVVVSSRAFGGLDLVLGRYAPMPTFIVGRDVLRLVKTPGANWKIDGRMLGPTLSVQTAIRELENLRSRTADADVKRNATQGLKVLRTLPREKR
jgi:hypothetical protein